jgi:hypothetical protein
MRAYGRWNPWVEYPRDGDRSVLLLLEWAGDHWFPEACYSVPWHEGTAVGVLWNSGLTTAELAVGYDLVPVPEAEALALVGWRMPCE